MNGGGPKNAAQQWMHIQDPECPECKSKGCGTTVSRILYSSPIQKLTLPTRARLFQSRARLADKKCLVL